MKTTSRTYAHRAGAGATGLAATCLAALLIAGCGSSSAGSTAPDRSGEIIPASWISTVDEQFAKAGPTSSTPVIESDAECALDADVKIDGSGTEGFGAGSSTLGDGGKRYVCDFRKPSTHLIVGTLSSDSDFAELTDSLKAQSQAGNEQTEESFTVDGRTIRVVRTVYPTNSSHIDYAASVVDPAKKAYALLDIETTDELKGSYSSRQAAEDFSSVLSG